MQSIRRRMTLLGWLCGGLIILAALSSASAILFHLEWYEARQKLAASRTMLRDLRGELRDAFARIEVRHIEEGDLCRDDLLRELRGLLLEFRHLRDFGLYDPQGRLYCSAGLGRLEYPLTDPTTSIVTDEGLLIWFDVPVLLAGNGVLTTLVRLGGHNVVLDPFFVRNLREQGVDLVWFQRGVRSKPLFRDPRLDNALTDSLLKDLVRNGSSGLHVDWRTQTIIFSDAESDSRFVLQIVRTPRQIIANRPSTSAALLALALCIGGFGLALVRGHVRQALSLPARLPALISRDHIRCCYQPIIDLDSGEIAGVEVLMRLIDGEDVIAPDQAIPAILERGLAWKLDWSVSLKAAQELAAIERLLPADRARLKVAFNFFPENLLRPEMSGLLDGLRQILAAHYDLNVEVTEYSFAPEMIDALRTFRARGVLVSVDDFGTGFSNLGTVKRVEPDFLKIDKSFVFEMEDASLRSNLIPEIVGIARAVGAEVVGEGVENAAQAMALKHMGVRYGQGYHFARPMPINELARHLLARRTPTPDLARAA